MLSRFIAPLTACALVLLAGCATSPEKAHEQADSNILTPDTILKPAAPIDTTTFMLQGSPRLYNEPPVCAGAAAPFPTDPVNVPQPALQPKQVRKLCPHPLSA